MGSFRVEASDSLTGKGSSALTVFSTVTWRRQPGRSRVSSDLLGPLGKRGEGEQDGEHQDPNIGIIVTAVTFL